MNNKTLKYISLICIILGLAIPALWHFYLLELWANSFPAGERDLGLGMSIMGGYFLALLCLGLFGIIAALTSAYAISKHGKSMLLIFEILISIAMSLFSITIIVMVFLS